MTKKYIPDFIFEVSWEVCNKVGGIHTVLESSAAALHDTFEKTKVIYVGPDLGKSEFEEDESISLSWVKALEKEGVKARIGRWKIPGKPIAVLVNIRQCFDKKNEIYGMMWEKFRVDSLNAYGDYDESSMWAYASSLAITAISKHCIAKSKSIVVQCHEWQSAMTLLGIKAHNDSRISTVFTTHATTVGRSICDNGKELYKYFKQYDGDIMAHELNVAAKHSSEKAAAMQSDCFTTVSDITAKECEHLLGRKCDVILPNGFNLSSVPAANDLMRQRKEMRAKIMKVANALTGASFNDNSTIIISTSGRCDYKPKGYDVYLESIKRLRLQESELKKKVLALVEVPCWVSGLRPDLMERLQENTKAGFSDALPNPFITHSLHNFTYDRLVGTITSLGLQNINPETKVYVILIPVYLDGNDGVFNAHYYKMLSACDLTAYPSYYEPWGYTPLESAAYGIPTVTTNLTGFGCWVESKTRKKPTVFENGISVVARDDDNYFEVAENLKNIFLEFCGKTALVRKSISVKANKNVADADWKRFVSNYAKAFSFAIEKQITKTKN